MFRNYLKTAIRNLLKYKGYSLINIMGLGIGMACWVLIMLFVRDELSYDRFHENADRIYRVAMKVQFPEQPLKRTAVTPTPLAPALPDEVPEVVAATRLLAYFEGALPGTVAVSYDEKEFNDRFFWADNSLAKVFSLDLARGNPETILTEPNTVVVTEEAARKYFGDENPMGKVLKIDSGFSEEDYVVDGVLADLPKNSHLHYDVLASMSSLYHIPDERVMMDFWGDFDSYTYALLAPDADPVAVEAKLPQVIEKHLGEDGIRILTLFLMPVTDIHLHSHLLNEIEPNSDVTYVYIFTAAAVVILLVACINFMNLATARSANRAREVGMRKVVGAHRSQLIGQFLGESLLVSALSMIVAVLVVKISLPAFNAFVDKEVTLSFDPLTWLMLLLVTVVVAMIAGSYPAFFLSSFRPVSVLGGGLVEGAKRAFFRKLLVVSQFVFSIILLIAACIVFAQLRYMRNFELGVDMERVVVVPVRDSQLATRYLAVKDRIEQLPNVAGTAFSAVIMGREGPDMGAALSKEQADVRLLSSLIVDQDWADFYGLEFVAGRNFDKTRGEAEMNAFILTESGMRELGFDTPEEALGQHVYWGGEWREGDVIGIVRDFHYQPLRFHVKPVIMLLRPIAYHFLAIKIGPGDLAATLTALAARWDEVFPNRPFDYFFLEDEFDRMYRGEQRLGQLVGFFSLVAVLLGCLGLLGLASFIAEQRTKEIGVRKVLGASVVEVVTLLSKEFTRPIVVAIVISWPIAYFIMREWLKDFAYRTEIGFGYFLLSGLAALAIAGLTVGFQTIRAAFTNPADALRYE